MLPNVVNIDFCHRLVPNIEAQITKSRIICDGNNPYLTGIHPDCCCCFAKGGQVCLLQGLDSVFGGLLLCLEATRHSSRRPLSTHLAIRVCTPPFPQLWLHWLHADHSHSNIDFQFSTQSNDDERGTCMFVNPSCFLNEVERVKAFSVSKFFHFMEGCSLHKSPSFIQMLLCQVLENMGSEKRWQRGEQKQRLKKSCCKKGHTIFQVHFL